MMLLFVACVHLTTFAKADDKNTGVLRGTVYTDNNKAAVGAVAQIKVLKKTALIDNDGVFSFSSIPVGNYTVHISLTGYQTVAKNVVIENGNTTTIEVTMKVANNNLTEFVISDSKNRYKRDKVSNSLRLNTPLKEIPQNIQVISANALADQQVISMSDGVLRNVSGATRLEHWGDMYTRVNMRGSRIPAFRNGVNISSTWGPLTEDMSFVDHIEVVKGPAGFMLANGDPAGLYNVVTKKPTGEGFNGEVGFTLGSFDLYRTTLDLDGNFDKDGKVMYRLNLMGQTKGSFRKYEFNDRYSIAPVVAFKLDDRTVLTLEYTLQHANMSNVGSYYLFSNGGYNENIDQSVSLLHPGIEPTVVDDHSVFVNLQHQINKDWKLTAQAAYFSYNQQGSSMWPTGALTPDNRIIRNVSVWDAAAEMKSGQVYLNGNAKTGSINHRVLAGIDVGTKDYWADWGQVHDLDDSATAFDPANPSYGAPANGFPDFDRTLTVKQRANMTNTTINQSYASVYLQDELGFFENRLRLTLAGRFSYASQSSYGGDPVEANHFTPRVGLSYSVDKNTSVYALYDQAFTPQAGVLRSGDGIKPLTGNNTEVGVKRDWFDGKWNSTLSVYRITKNNELTADPNNIGSEQYSIVLGEKIAEGIEVDINGQLAKGLNLILNYAFTDSRVTEVAEGVTSINVGDKIAGYARHTANAWISYRVMNGALKGAGVSLGASYMADRTTWTWGAAGQQPLPNYFRLDGGLFWQRGKVRLAANVFNLLDEYLYSGSYYAYGDYYYWQAEAPINGRFSISYKF